MSEVFHKDVNLFAKAEIKPSKLGLNSLPIEIVVEIFKLLHWKDLLNARQICTFLYNASKSREIWGNLIRVHAAAAHEPPTIFDKPMRMYNPIKLEERFLRWMKTESTWLDGISLNERYIPDFSHKFLYSHLLRGGRWLICSDSGGEVLYCDLESPETGFVSLIPYPISCQGEAKSMMAIEEDPETETLSFKIALVHILVADYVKGPHGQPEVTGDSRVDVWSGCVILDEDGQGMGLQVEQLASVRISLYLGQPLFGVSLRGPLIAFTVQWHLFDTRTYAHDAIIIDWMSPRSQSQSFRRKTVNYRTDYAGNGQKDEVMLLPEGRVLTVIPQGIRIYEHSHVPWSSEKRPVCVDMSIPEQYSCDVTVPESRFQHPCGFSKVFHLSDNEYRVVFNTLTGIWGLIVRYPETGNLEARALELLPWRKNLDYRITEYRSHFSYNYGVAYSNSGYLLRARFAWPDEEDLFETGTSSMLCKPKERHLVMNADIAAGRLAWIGSQSGRVAMSDI
ncbi:hypothetical protein AGABI1DRAFT_132396 [Agaricus bisporus var. burnettii JB137-S8]|uniref:F-box domain-containing protein n=1 Tax=Agaricus bisporus var. burnettii (strain JB137-S8 / ATCC MYA-4627 / FGSC 10392) TaxID=597362 RepID=K5XL59_AGABU|nr:uncharacterized protein AGABI1DRAFT_132396 [Agaricus bisporus var. burnettii JB137-S8]EKM75255.1 hypothetical protein AGABI1DRAFT_132396 [Agaricus bisporus var. burnettii JB137-S8]